MCRSSARCEIVDVRAKRNHAVAATTKWRKYISKYTWLETWKYIRRSIVIDNSCPSKMMKHEYRTTRIMISNNETKVMHTGRTTAVKCFKRWKERAEPRSGTRHAVYYALCRLNRTRIKVGKYGCSRRAGRGGVSFPEGDGHLCWRDGHRMLKKEEERTKRRMRFIRSGNRSWDWTLSRLDCCFSEVLCK